MSKRTIGSAVWRGLWAFVLQSVVMGAVCLAACLTEIGPAWLCAVALYIAAPLAGGVTAFRAVGMGLSNYLAWIAPPFILYAVHLLLWGYVPPVAAALVMAFVAVVGAAAGEVRRLQQKTHREK